MRSRIWSFSLALTLLLGGCATSHMDVVRVQDQVLGPPPGTSLIYFLRPAVFGGSDSAVVFDDQFYIGTLQHSHHIAYVTKPGKHLFMVVSESADFMEADLEPDKTYYATVRRRFGIVKERFSFSPHNDAASIEEARATVAQTAEVRANETGERWVNERRSRIERMREKYFRVWETKKSKQTLAASSGR